MESPRRYRFSFGPWNISEGADPFGPPVREPYSLLDKLDQYGPLGFEGVQFHDDDIVEGLDELTPEAIRCRAREVKAMLDDRQLTPEFVAPRLWFHPATIDGAYTSNSAADRRYASNRSRQAIDIAREIGCTKIVLWLAREGTYIRESKNPVTALRRIVEAVNEMLAYDSDIEIWIEPKPNEPVDSAFVPTIGHAIALAYQTTAPSRVRTIVETAHSILAGLDPAEDMAFALAHDKLGSVHLNDQAGLKFDEDKSFGSANLRSAFNQVLVLEENGYGSRGEFVGLDVKAVRTQKQAKSLQHLANSRNTFLHLLDRVRGLDAGQRAAFVEDRNYEALDQYVLTHLLGVSSPTRGC